MFSKKSLVLLVAAGAVGTLFYGCAEDGSDGSTDVPDTGADIGTVDHSVGDEPTPVVDSGPKDAAKKDSSTVKDAGKPDTGAEGSPCNPSPGIETQPCAFCGTQTRACLQSGDAGYVWGAWGACLGSVTTADKCEPGPNLPDVDCGNCGKMKQVCGSDCHLDNTQVCVEPANACKANDVEFVLGLSCTGANEGRSRTCSATCQWGAPGACTTPPLLPLNVDIATSAAGVVTKQFAFDASVTLGKLGTGTCPKTVSSSITMYNYISIRNTTAQTATVSVWSSKVTNDIDTVMGWYASPVPPKNNDDTARGACTGTVNDSCTPATECAGQWAGLIGANAISIPAGGFVTVYHAAYFASATAGPYNLNVRTDALN